MYRQILDPVAHSLAWSSLVAALPLAMLFVMLGVLRMRAWVASLLSLAVAVAIAVAVYGMPIGQTLLAGGEGAVFGFFPILWIVINAIWVYQMTVQTGHFDVLRRSFASVSDDHRIQAIIIAFSFGALLEALAGFGTPVAVTSVMLLALGFKPLKAAVLALVANTAPVAFGAMATPIITLGKVSGVVERHARRDGRAANPHHGALRPAGAGGHRRRPARTPRDLARGPGGRRGFRPRPIRDLELSISAAGRRGRLAAVRRCCGLTAARLASAARIHRAARRGSWRAAPPTPCLAEGEANLADRLRAEVARAYAPYGIIIAVFVSARSRRSRSFWTRPPSLSTGRDCTCTPPRAARQRFRSSP